MTPQMQRTAMPTAAAAMREESSDPDVSAAPRRPDLGFDLMRCMWRAQEADSSIPRTDAAARVVSSMFEENIGVLRRIMDGHGWPGYRLVGEKAARAAWYIAQGCPDTELQGRALELLVTAVRAGDANPLHCALLADRICFNRGEPQRFGTLYVPNGLGDAVLYRVGEPDRLDDRRNALGLPPHAEYEADIKREPLAGTARPLRP